MTCDSSLRKDVRDIPGALQNPQDQCTVFIRFEEDDVVAVRAATKPWAEFRASHIVQRTLCNQFALLADFADERDGAPGTVERDVVTDLFEVGLGLRRDIGTHRLFPLLGGLGVFALKAIEDLGGRLRLPALPAFFDLTAQSIERSPLSLLLLLEQAQRITQDFACAGVTAAVDLVPYEPLEVLAEGIAGWHVWSPQRGKYH